MRLRLKVLLGLLITLIILNVTVIVYDIKKEIQLNDKLIQNKLEIINERLDMQLMIIKIMDKTDMAIIDYVKYLNNKIDINHKASVLRDTQLLVGIPNVIKVQKFLLEQKLKQVNIMIHNTTRMALGSGVSIKYRGKFYILSAGHMAENNTDKLELWENDMKICDLKILKHEIDYTEEKLSEADDLILLVPTDKNIVPKFYVELADFEPITGTELYVVGNPMGIEDVVSEGRIIIYQNNFMYYINHSYYGNSGGGIYTKEGKLIGIMCHYQNLKEYTPYVDAPDYIIYGAVRLSVIQKFLGDIK